MLFVEADDGVEVDVGMGVESRKWRFSRGDQKYFGWALVRRVYVEIRHLKA